MWSRDRPNLYDGEYWAWDNGAYSWWVNGQAFHDVSFLKRLWRDYLVGVPYLAACPDMPAEGMDSLEFSMWWIDRLPKAWPWYLVVQDGMTVEGVEEGCRGLEGCSWEAPTSLKHQPTYGVTWHTGKTDCFIMADVAPLIK